MGRTVGIDLGTTNSVVAVLEGGEPTVIPNHEGARTTPSIFAVSKAGGEVLVGEVAKRQSVMNVTRTVRSVKRHMGSDWAFDCDGKTWRAQEVSAQVLAKLKRDAEAFLGEEVDGAVITVPAYFNDAQRQATKDAGEIAGLRVLRIINEPTAAALAYGLDKGEDLSTILVFDLGGGTFDVSLLTIGGGVVEVRATSGDNNLGGDDWDQAIVAWLLQRFQSEHGVDLSCDVMALQRVRDAAEAAKIELSSAQKSTITLPYITMLDGQPLMMEYDLTRAEFQRITEELLDRLRIPFANVLTDAEMSADEIDHVVLVGGSTRMPAVGTLVRELSGREPSRNVNPDEVVAAGAALQGGVLSGEVTDVLLIDVLPLTLGIETRGGVMTPLIERNTAIPSRVSEIFSTAEDGQASVAVQVFQGERQMARANRLLGTFCLADIAPAPRGVPQIEVSLDVDANGIVHVSARDLGTGRAHSMTISGGSALSKDDIARMVGEAQQFADADRAQRELAQERNVADVRAHQSLKFLRECGERVEGSLSEAVRAALSDLERAVGGQDVTAIRVAVAGLEAASQAMGAALYASVAAADAAAEAPRPQGTAPSAAEAQAWFEPGEQAHEAAASAVPVGSTSPDLPFPAWADGEEDDSDEDEDEPAA